MDDTRFVREIRMQPAALRTVAEFYSGAEGKRALREAAGAALMRRRIVFTGMGTSLHVPSLIRRELEAMGMQCDIRDAGELLHFGMGTLTGDETLIAISQSGESAETRRVVEAAKGRTTVISLVNNPVSAMGRLADLVLPLRAGEEASISAKTYTNTLAALLLFSTALGGGDIDAETAILSEIADSMETEMEHAGEAARQAAEYFGNPANLHVVARGSDLVIASQLALILKEGAGMFSEALSAGLFRHGPLEIAGEGHSVVCILSRENEPGLTAGLACELAGLGSRVLLLADSREYTDFSGMTVAWNCPARHFPLVCAPFIELFVHETAKLRGKQAGVFRTISKVTDRE